MRVSSLVNPLSLFDEAGCSSVIETLEWVQWHVILTIKYTGYRRATAENEDRMAENNAHDGEKRGESRSGG